MHNYSFIVFRNEIHLKPFCIIIHLNCINIHFSVFIMEIICWLLVSIMEIIYGISFSHQHICVRACIYGQKITAPFNGVVSFIGSSYIIAGNSVVRQTVDARLINDLWIRFPIYRVRIKPERKCVGFRLLLGLFLIWLIPMLSNYTSIDVLVSVWFYFIIIFIIKFVLMIFNMKFVSDGLQTVFDMKIELRISPVHLLTCYTIR